MNRQILKAVVLFILFILCFHQTSCIYSNPLLLTPLIRNGNVSSAKQLSKVNPDGFRSITSYSGFVTVNAEYNSNLFYWYFPRPDQEHAPWIIWLNGGPGVTSLLGLFDFGPIEVEDGQVKLRNESWASNYSLLFVDNPVGAGFSFTDDERGYTSSLEEVRTQLYQFLQQFLEMFPELRSAPLYVAGESYAGKYVPALAAAIHERKDADRHINLKGIILGNALIDPRSMLNSNHSYSVLTNSLGLLVDDETAELKRLEQSIVRLIGQAAIVNASNKFNETIEYIKKNTGVNIYNYLKKPECIQCHFEGFITSPRVREDIHVGNASFDLNNQVVYRSMLPDIMNSSKVFVEELLEHYGVMCYSGELDLIIPYSLSKGTYNSLQWSRSNHYRRSKRSKIRLTADGDVVGYRKSGGYFVEYMVRGAGHMVAREKPRVLKYIVDSFVKETSKIH